MRETVFLVLGAVVAVALQVILAPSIAIMGAMPNFILVYVGIAAMMRQSDSVYIMAFASGLAYDLVGTGAVGLMAALLTFVAFLSSRVSVILGNESFGVSLMVSMVCSLLVELAFAACYIVSADASVVSAIFMRALPCALYDCAMALIVFPPLSMLFIKSAPSHKAPESSTVRLR